MAQKGCAMTWLACVLAVVCAVRPCRAQMVYNTTVGQFPATEANGPANPSCGYGPLSMTSFPFGRVASINASSPILQGLPQNGCGACFQVTCEAGADCEASNQPLVVQQVDSGSANFIIRMQEFVDLAPAYLGNIPVSVQLVNCSISGNIVIRVLQYRGTGGGYLQLTFLNINGGIDSVLIGASQANLFQPMYNQEVAVWVASNLPPPPLDVRIISSSGPTVTAVGVITNTSTGDFPTDVQFATSSQTDTAPPALSEGVAVYTFPPSVPETSPSSSQSPPQPVVQSTNGPPPSSPLPPLANASNSSLNVPVATSEAPAEEASKKAAEAASPTAPAPAPIPVCGPSLLQLTDAVFLPYNVTASSEVPLSNTVTNASSAVVTAG